MNKYQQFALATLLVQCVSGCVTPKLSVCNKDPWRKDLHYGDKVNIVDGFFKGSRGTVLGQAWIYRHDNCNVAGFNLDINNKKSYMNTDGVVNQDFLEKETDE